MSPFRIARRQDAQVSILKRSRIRVQETSSSEVPIYEFPAPARSVEHCLATRLGTRWRSRATFNMMLNKEPLQEDKSARSLLTSVAPKKLQKAPVSPSKNVSFLSYLIPPAAPMDLRRKSPRRCRSPNVVRRNNTPSEHESSPTLPGHSIMAPAASSPYSHRYARH